jgi:hypothetical protein
MDLTGIVLLILALALIGFLVHLIVTKIPMDDTFKQIIIVIVVIVAVLYCLGLITGNTSLPSLRIR